ncbi:TRAF3-interacting protein 1-like isoform X2 [Anopheles albimanus]|nr:TRAF3-interacting protein 1-like isoform X2 [Anopheles albimanus]
MAFLQKLIDVVKLLTDRDLKVRPSKVVAGLEVERTNELLQALGYALEQKLSSADIVRQYLAASGDVSASAPNNAAIANGSVAPDAQPTRKEPVKDRSKDKETAGVDKRKDRHSKPKEKETARNGIAAVAVDPKSNDAKGKSKVQNGAVKVSNDPKRKVDKPTKGKDKERSLKRIPSIPEEQLQPAPPQPPMVKDRSSNDMVSNSAANGAETLPNGKQSHERRKRRDSYKESAEPVAVPLEDEAEGGSLTMEEENERHRKQNGTGSNSSSRRSSLKKQNSLTPSENNALSEMNQFNGLESSPGPSRQDSGTGSDPPPATAIETTTLPEPMAAGGGGAGAGSTMVSTADPLTGAGEGHPRGVVTGKPPMHRQQSVETVLRPRTSLRPPSVRPPSARPGAPRRKEKNVEVVLQPNEMQKLGDINVKMEVFNSELLDDDGENLIVIEDPITAVDDVYGGAGAIGGVGMAADGGEATQHHGQQGQGHLEEHQGHLVQQILETQKEFSTHANHDGELLRKAQETEWSIGQRQSSAKQMELLRESIQKLTRSVNPLGKLMDFIQEDVDSMERELANWQQIYSRSIVELNKERSATENAIEPLKHQLSQIEISIKEYREMIDSTRATILQNEQKIERLYMTEL